VLLGLGLWRVIGAWVDRRMGNGGGPPGALPAGVPVSRRAHDGVLARPSGPDVLARPSGPDEIIGAVGANL
jgi:hypothetical protein